MEDASAAAIIDARGILTGWSEGAQRLTGYPAREALGRAVRELLADAVPPVLDVVRSELRMNAHADRALTALRAHRA